MPIATASRSRIALAIGAPLAVLVGVPILLIIKGYSILEYPILIMNGELTWWKQLLGLFAFILWIWAFLPKSIDALKHPILIEENGDHILLRDWPDPIHKNQIVDVVFKPYAAVRKLTVHLSCGKKVDQAAFLFAEDGYEVARSVKRL